MQIKKIYNKIFPQYINELEKVIDDCKNVLDLGCGSDSPIRSFSHKFYSVGLDIFKSNIIRSKQKNIHNKYYLMSVLDIDKRFKENQFDCVLASDLIEHLTKEDSEKLIKKMEKIAKKKVIIFTPNGFLPQKAYDNNKWQEHKSGWAINEMRNKGYKIRGINGLKFLRKEHAELRFKPYIIWKIISDITQFFVRNNPKHAFQILCIKEK